MRHRRKKHRLMKMILILLLIVVLIAAGGVGAMLIAEENCRKNAAPEKGEAIIVLGAQVKENGELSLQLRLRLEKALEAWNARPRPIVVCGGQGSNEPCTEADAMAEYLTAHGVPGEMILKDTGSINTYQNIANAAELLGDQVKDVLIVTSDYHMPRSLAIARDAGFNAWGIPAKTMNEYWLKNHAREALAWVKYAVQRVTGWDLNLPI